MNKLLLATLMLGTCLRAADPEIGTWKLNVAESKLRDPGAMANATMIIEPVEGHSVRTTFTRTAKDGQTIKTEDVRTCDGKERPS